MGKLLMGISRATRSERGAALAEWGLLVVLIAVVALIAVTYAGDQVSGTYSYIAESVDL